MGLAPSPFLGGMTWVLASSHLPTLLTVLLCAASGWEPSKEGRSGDLRVKLGLERDMDLVSAAGWLQPRCGINLLKAAVPQMPKDLFWFLHLTPSYFGVSLWPSPPPPSENLLLLK